MSWYCACWLAVMVYWDAWIKQSHCWCCSYNCWATCLKYTRWWAQLFLFCSHRSLKVQLVFSEDFNHILLLSSADDDLVVSTGPRHVIMVVCGIGYPCLCSLMVSVVGCGCPPSCFSSWLLLTFDSFQADALSSLSCWEQLRIIDESLICAHLFLTVNYFNNIQHRYFKLQNVHGGHCY